MPSKVSLPTDLEQSIFRTVAWFSLFEFPVTSFEIWKWLIEPTAPYRLEQVTRLLQTSQWLASRLESESGFFILSGHGTAALRHRRFLDAARKYHRLGRALTYLSLVPSVQAIASCNTLAWSNTKPESDIDLFVIARAGTLWLTRLLCVLPFALLGRRPAAGIEDPFCFSFFASETCCDFSSLRLHKRDLYLGQWIRSCAPQFFRDREVFEVFQKANGWVSGLFPNSFEVRPAAVRRVRAHRLFLLPSFLEPLARFLQRSRLPRDLQLLANKDSRVIVTDDMLKFHPNDRREEFFRCWQSLCSSV